MTGAALARLRRARFGRVLALSAAIGAAYGLATGERTAPFVNALAGVINGTVIAAAIAGIEMFALRRRPLRRIAALPFALVLALKTLTYGAISALVLGAALAERLLGEPQDYDLGGLSRTVGFSLLVAALFVIVLQAGGLVGYRTFRSLLLGHYRMPKVEHRFFLFVDLVGSTALAERVGPLAMHRFLSRLFAALAEPIAASGGEIYQYVGDEIVITWPRADGTREAHALRCFFEMRRALSRDEKHWRASFAALPELRAALHFGEVVAGEVGEERRAIVFHGDVMNAAARLEQVARERACSFVASQDALDALALPAELRVRDLGSVALRGRREPVRAFAVEAT